ncbi:MAG: molybdate ABC transporter substrate-binding protein [Candidatus Sericytochromatia bacterium]|nr:molybdate ABC transporter substrate-binding protein [Candidatus Sericytochromatia bacterium]
MPACAVLSGARWCHKAWLCLLMALLISWPVEARAAVIRVAAAASLQHALPEMVSAFEKQSPHRLRVSFGSSGQFAAQIQQGAPFELFLSADESYVQRVQAAGLTQDAGVLYALGRIVLFAPTGSALVPERGLTGLKQALAQGRIKHLAIANPAHAPYGRAAREALQATQIWPLPKPARLLQGENASQAAQFALSGSAEAGILPYSLVVSPAFQGRGTYALIPDTLHQPLRQRMVLLTSAGAPAREFYAYLQKPIARQIFGRYGFVLP